MKNKPINSDVLSEEQPQKPDRAPNGTFLRPPANAAPPITSANAREMVQKRIAKKRAIIRESANAAVQSGSLRAKYGEEAWIAEVAQAQMQIATTPDAGKASTLAAEWLVNNAGMGEKQIIEQAGAPLQQIADDISDSVARLEDVFRDVMQQQREVVDGRVIEATPIRTENEADDE